MPVDDEIGRIRAASRVLVREWGILRNGFGPDRMPSSICHLLVELENAGPLSVLELAERLNLDKGLASRVISRAEEQGWITRIADAHDRRRRTVRLTAAGRRRAAAVDVYSDNFVASWWQKLDARQRRDALRGLELVAQVMQAQRCPGGGGGNR